MSALIEFDEVCKYYQMGDTLAHDRPRRRRRSRCISPGRFQ